MLDLTTKDLTYPAFGRMQIPSRQSWDAHPLSKVFHEELQKYAKHKLPSENDGQARAKGARAHTRIEEGGGSWTEGLPAVAPSLESAKNNDRSSGQ